MATIEEVTAAIQAADRVGDSASVRALAPVYKAMRRALAEEQTRTEMAAEYDPTKGMGAIERTAAGFHKAFRDVGRGVGQLVGAYDQQEIDELKKQDAPLMRTTAGRVGNVAGDVAAVLPTMFIPGANTVTGAAAIGAGMGATQPVATGESRLRNIGLGAAGGAGGVLAGRALAAGAQGARALVEPLTAKGRDRIAGRTLAEFGVPEQAVVGVSNAPTVTGARPMLAEQITDPAAAAGAARLQDAVRTADPTAAGKFVAREAENNAARVGTMRELAGADGARDFADQMRKGTAKHLYDEAFLTLDFSKLPKELQLSAAEKGEITKLMRSPAIQEAIKSAKQNALNEGKKVTGTAGSIEGLHGVKMALDDMISNAGTSAAQVNKAMSIKSARDRLLTFMERMSPKYGDARRTYAEMSKPINAMDTADALLKKGTSATGDLSGTPRLMPEALNRAAGAEEKLIAQATGRDLPQKTLKELFAPQDYAKLQGVLSETDKLAAVGRAANGPGSATAQRLASRNILRQTFGPLGLPESWAESTLLNTAMRPVQFAYSGVAEPKIQETLTKLIMNPEEARRVLLLARTAPQRLPANVQRALPYLEQAMKTSVPATLLSSPR
jgi:hypothetical protein